MRPRLAAMFSWLSSVWRKSPIDLAAEEKAVRWLQSGMQGKPPAGATTTDAFIQFLRSSFEPIRSEAAKLDPTEGVYEVIALACGQRRYTSS